MTWMTEERNGASATGAPTCGRLGAAVTTPGDLQIRKQTGFVPAAYGPGLVCGGTTVTSHTNDHVEMGRTAWDGTPLGSSGAGYG
jgi:hypothetical protein